MSTISTPSAATEVSALPPDERRARKLALQSELEMLDEVRVGFQNVVRELHHLQDFLDKNPVRFRSLYNRNVETCSRYTEAFARVSNEYRERDEELTALCSPTVMQRAIARLEDEIRCTSTGGAR